MQEGSKKPVQSPQGDQQGQVAERMERGEIWRDFKGEKGKHPTSGACLLISRRAERRVKLTPGSSPVSRKRGRWLAGSSDTSYLGHK